MGITIGNFLVGMVTGSILTMVASVLYVDYKRRERM